MMYTSLTVVKQCDPAEVFVVFSATSQEIGDVIHQGKSPGPNATVTEAPQGAPGMTWEDWDVGEWLAG